MKEQFEKYLIVIDNTTYECVINFTIYVNCAIPESRDTPFFHQKDADIPGFTEKTEEAEVFLDGAIRFDGCSNWDFNNVTGATHFCGKDDAISLGRLMEYLYNLAEKYFTERGIQ